VTLLSNHTCLSGLNFKILDSTALDKDLGTCFSAWTWRVICAWLSKYLLSRNVRVLRFLWEHSLWLCSSGIWCHITGCVPLKCQELFTEWYDVMAQKHGVLREKHVSSKVAEKNSKYPFPKSHFQDNQIKWSKTGLFMYWIVESLVKNFHYILMSNLLSMFMWTEFVCCMLPILIKLGKIG
jgi:hypothetical protein